MNDAEFEAAKAKIKSLGDTIHIKTDIDNGTLSKIAQDTEAIHRMMGANQALRIKADLDDAEAKARLEALTRDRTTVIHTRVNKSDLDQAESLISKIGSLLGGGHSFNLPFTNMTANPIGLTAIIGGIAALLPELAGVVSGFAAAGAGAVAFGALATPAVKSVMGAYSALNAAQAKYNAAKAREALDPSKANAAALKSAADGLKLAQEQLSKLPASEQMAITGLQKLSTSFHAMSKAFEPQVFSVFNSGLRLMSTLLPTIAPFASTFASSMTKWLTNLNNSAHGSGFQNFIKSLHQIEGPALQAITAGIGNVAGSIGRLLTVMSGKDVAHTLNIAFSAISGTIGGLTSTIRFLMTAWDGMGLAMQNVKGTLHGLAGMFDNVRHGLADMGASMLHGLEGIPASIASIASKMVAPFKGVPSKIIAIFAGASGWLNSAGEWVISGFVKGAESTWGAVSGFFSGIGGKVKAFFAGAAGWLVSVGENIIQGLINGLESKLGALSGVVSKIAGIVKSVAGMLGIHSPSTVMYGYGVNAAEGLALGMMAGAGQVGHAASTLAGMVSGPAAAAAGGHAGAGGGEIHIHNVIQLDGKVLHSEMSKHAVQAQRRTGSNQYTKRTR